MFEWMRGNKNRQPKSDPIGDICRSLAERWWEWSTVNAKDSMFWFLQHFSGATLAVSDRSVTLSGG